MISLLGRVRSLFACTKRPIPNFVCGRVDWARERVLGALDRLLGGRKAVPEFRPLRVTLKRGGKDYPVVIERATLEKALSSLSGNLLGEAQAYASRLKPAQVPFILLVKNLEGMVEGIGISTLIPFGSLFAMNCDRDLKVDRDPQTGIQNVGPAILIARLRFMKQSGYWYPHTEILYGYDPHLLNAYRIRCGLEVWDPYGLGLHSVTRYEGRGFLENSPLTFQEGH